MFEYLKFLISNVKSFDKRIKNIVFFQNKTWIRLSPNGFKEKWFFRSNGLLTISRDGNVIDGKYQFLNDYLIIEFLNSKILLNKSSIDNEILLLVKDSNASELFAFYDDSKFSPDAFLEHLESSRKNDLNIKQLSLVDNTKAEIIRKPNQKGVNIGNTVLVDGQLSNQEYIETDYNYYYLKNGKVSSIFYSRRYKIYGNQIVVKQKKKKLSINDVIVSSEQDFSNGLHKINFIYGMYTEDYIIKKNIFHLISGNINKKKKTRSLE